jgi:DNA-binding transcriptional LysR family regulator
VEIQLRHDSSGELIEQVRTGRLDVAFVSRPSRCPDDVMLALLRMVADGLRLQPV